VPGSSPYRNEWRKSAFDDDVEAVSELVQELFVIVACFAEQGPGGALILDVEPDLVAWAVGPQGCPDDQGRDDRLKNPGREFAVFEGGAMHGVPNPRSDH
jgi:hypothetical protein